MPYHRDNRLVFHSCLLVILVAVAIAVAGYAVLTRGFSVPIQCVFGQESNLRTTLKVRVSDESSNQLEQALREIAERRGMVFGARANNPRPSGQPSSSFHVCGTAAYLIATEDRDSDRQFVIHISQATNASDEQAAALEADVNAWIDQRQGQ